MIDNVYINGGDVLFENINISCVCLKRRRRNRKKAEGKMLGMTNQALKQMGKMWYKIIFRL